MDGGSLFGADVLAAQDAIMNQQNMPMPQQMGYPMQNDMFMQGNLPMQDNMYMQGTMPMQGGMPMQGQMGYPQMNGMYMQRPNKAMIIQALHMYVSQNFGRPPMITTKIEEEPDTIRHACIYHGISRLPKYTFPIPEFGVSIPFYFCKSCGKLYYPRDFMF